MDRHSEPVARFLSAHAIDRVGDDLHPVETAHRCEASEQRSKRECRVLVEVVTANFAASASNQLDANLALPTRPSSTSVRG